MHSRRLLFVLGLVAPFVLGLGGCFITADGERYEDTVGTGGDGCQVGFEGCACTSGGACNDPFYCHTNLNICVSDTCPRGSDGCHCTEGGACDPGLSCFSDYCVDPGVCTLNPGIESCPCTDGGGCDPGLVCLSEVCVDASGLTTGEDPTVDPSTTEPPSTTEAPSDTSSDGADSSTTTPDPDTSTG